jgi:hypothetical protein
LTAVQLHPERRADLSRETRGAISIIGLAAGCFLVGSMWWTVGIGRAVMLHDKLQETADAMAAAGSTVHARGMNLISTINLVMLALVAIFIIMSIILDIIRAGLIAVIACASTVYGAPVCGPFVEPAREAESTASNIRDGYRRVMEPTLTALAYVQTSVAVVMPITAQVVSVRTAVEYKEVGIAFSPSVVPGGTPALDVSVSGIGLSGFKLGLPVAHEKMGKLCEMAGAYSASWLRKSLRKIPGLSLIIGLPGIRSLVDRAIQTLSTAVRQRYCTGSFWESNGPKQIWGPAENGNDWMQSWSFVLTRGKTDPNERLVSIGTYRYAISGAPRIDMPNFFAQAEMFFDCDDTWRSYACNGPKKVYDYSIYGLQWTSRLRRFHPPSFGGLLGSALGQYLSSGEIFENIPGGLEGLDQLRDLAGGLGGEAGQAAADDVFGFLQGKADEQLGKARSAVVGKVAGGGNGPTSLIIH